MKDKFSGQLDLTSLFDPSVAPVMIKSFAPRGDHVARDDDAVCAVIGSPTFGESASTATSPAAGIASELLKAWRENGVELASRIHGAYAFAIVGARRECVFLAVDRFAIHTSSRSIS